MTALVYHQQPYHGGGHHQQQQQRPTATGTEERRRQEREEFQQLSKRIITGCIDLATRGEITVELSTHQLQIVHVVNSMVRSRREFFHATVTDLQLTPTNTALKLREVWNAIFVDDIINAGRILTMLCFCQYVTQYADRVESRLPSLRDSVPYWAAVFITNRLRDWIISQGGWDSLQLPRDEVITSSSNRSATTSSSSSSCGTWFEQGLRGLAYTISFLDALPYGGNNY